MEPVLAPVTRFGGLGQMASETLDSRIELYGLGEVEEFSLLRFVGERTSFQAALVHQRLL